MATQPDETNFAALIDDRNMEVKKVAAGKDIRLTFIVEEYLVWGSSTRRMFREWLQEFDEAEWERKYGDF